MKIFLDTADVEMIRPAYETGLIDGVTTNPSLILKSGRTLSEVAKELVECFKFGKYFYKFFYYFGTMFSISSRNRDGFVVPFHQSIRDFLCWTICISESLSKEKFS